MASGLSDRDQVRWSSLPLLLSMAAWRFDSAVE